jgi:hypothetical protein
MSSRFAVRWIRGLWSGAQGETPVAPLGVTVMPGWVAQPDAVALAAVDRIGTSVTNLLAPAADTGISRTTPRATRPRRDSPRRLMQERGRRQPVPAANESVASGSKIHGNVGFGRVGWSRYRALRPQVELLIDGGEGRPPWDSMPLCRANTRCVACDLRLC